MDLISWCVVGIGGIATAVVTHILSSEICERMPLLAKRLVGKAVSVVPAPWRSRYEEEWQADIQERPAGAAKVWYASGCLISAYKLQRLFSRFPLRIVFEDQIVAFDFATGILVLNALGPNKLPSMTRTEIESWVAAACKMIERAQHEMIPPGARASRDQLNALRVAMDKVRARGIRSIDIRFHSTLSGPRIPEIPSGSAATAQR
jgi:hypothetical protein